MTKLMKPRIRNRQLSPWSNRLMTPWNNNPLMPFSDKFFSSKFDDLQNLLKFDDIFKDDFFEDDSLMPAMNIKENKKDFAIEFAAPGFSKKDFEVSIEDNVLHVYGEKTKDKEEKEEGYTCKEFSYNSFRRSLVLPENVDLNQKIKATYKDGILNVNLLKKEEFIKEIPKKIIEIG